MKGLNKVMLIGRLGQDPQSKFTKGGKDQVKFSLATNSTYMKGNQKYEQTEWHRVVAFGNIARIMGEYLKKGSLVYIEGSLKSGSYVDQYGHKHPTTTVIANTFQFLPSTRKEDQEIHTDIEDVPESEMGGLNEDGD